LGDSNHSRIGPSFGLYWFESDLGQFVLKIRMVFNENGKIDVLGTSRVGCCGVVREPYRPVFGKLYVSQPRAQHRWLIIVKITY
jgi:hypothetical protein